MGLGHGVPLCRIACYFAASHGLPGSSPAQGGNRPSSQWLHSAAPLDRHERSCGTKALRKVARPREANRWKYALLVHRPSKLAFCKMPKVANTQFARMFNALNGRNVTASGSCCGGWARRGRYGECYWDSAAGRYNITKHEFLVRGNGWKLAAFVRDPLERFLSAFLNNNFKAFCCLDGSVVRPNVAYSKHTRIRAFEAFVNRSSWRCPERGATASCLGTNGPDDPHWRHQLAILQQDCGFGVDRLDFLGRLTNDRVNVNLQVRDMLRAVFGVGSRRLVGYARRFFPAAGHTREATLQRDLGSHREVLAYYRRRETIDHVLGSVQQDYAAFKMELPSWTHQAYGRHTSSAGAGARETDHVRRL